MKKVTKLFSMSGNKALIFKEIAIASRFLRSGIDGGYFGGFQAIRAPAHLIRSGILKLYPTLVSAHLLLVVVALSPNTG